MNRKEFLIVFTAAIVLGRRAAAQVVDPKTDAVPTDIILDSSVQPIGKTIAKEIVCPIDAQTATVLLDCTKLEGGPRMVTKTVVDNGETKQAEYVHDDDLLITYVDISLDGAKSWRFFMSFGAHAGMACEGVPPGWGFGQFPLVLPNKWDSSGKPVAFDRVTHIRASTDVRKEMGPIGCLVEFS